jgi:hypothetical protein
MSEKIRPQHTARKAILYIRQSSAYQVSHNIESQKLQYAMEDRLQRLGWREIEVVDEDLGRSASGTVTRIGFERMVAQVCLGQVGAVAAREVSRFARNSREWQQLVEVCRVVDTVLIDQETLRSRTSMKSCASSASQVRLRSSGTRLVANWSPCDGIHALRIEAMTGGFCATELGFQERRCIEATRSLSFRT